MVEGPQKWRVIYEDPRTSTRDWACCCGCKGLWRSSARGLAEAGRENRYRHQRLERSLWSVPERESDLVLSYTTSPAYHMIEEKKDNYAAASFAEGHYLQVEVAARTAASKQPELAEKFLKFMVSPGFQNAIPTGNWMYPVTKVTLPAGFDTW
ncbi:thiamine ABC transporter substrate-binding protein [Klebsiella pneumoniae]|nr:thiamine ABC transporter substrate-binding protein [Klebsiella pneumoniae]